VLDELEVLDDDEESDVEPDEPDPESDDEDPDDEDPDAAGVAEEEVERLSLR
jgi:hypothetical protein